MKKTVVCIMTALLLLIGATPVTVLPQEKEAEAETTYGTGTVCHLPSGRLFGESLDESAD